MPKAEKTDWLPTDKTKQPKESVKILYGMKCGQTLRISHDDVPCDKTRFGNYTCVLKNKMAWLRKQGWELQSYHEAQYVLVVRRIK